MPSRRVWKYSTVCLLVIAAGCAGPRDYLERGDRAFAKGSYVEASLNYRKAIQKNSQFGEAFHRLATCEFRQGKLSEALSSFERALQLKPEDDGLRAEFVDAALSAYLLDTSRPKALYDEINKLIQELLVKNPNSYDGLRFEASVLYADGRVSDAIGLFRRANSIKAMQPEVILPLADALRKNGQAGEAESLAAELIRQHKDYGPVYDWLYSQYTATNRPGDAESVLVTRVANNPKDANALLQLAAHYHRAMKTEQMSAALKKIQDDPADFPNRYRQVADFYSSIGAWDEALRSLKAGLTSEPKQAGILRRRMVGVYLGEKKWNDAIDLLSQLIKEQPNARDLRAQRAEALVDGGDISQAATAIAECQALIKEMPG